MVRYEGIFFDDATSMYLHLLEPYHLLNSVDNIHCTFKYKPSDDEVNKFDDIVGSEVTVLLTGYGNNGQNSGFEIKLPDEIMEYYINYDEDNPDKLKKQHITISLGQGAKAVNTKNLLFEPLTEPIQITGRFGYWVTEGKESPGYVSYEKNKDKSFK